MLDLLKIELAEKFGDNLSRTIV